MGKRKIAATAADSTLPKTPVTIGGKLYNLCFDLGALSEAEFAINAEIARAGRSDFVNLLYVLPVQNLGNTRIAFAAAVRTFHSEISYDEALQMITLADVWDVAEAIRGAWKAATPEATANPPEAQAK